MEAASPEDNGEATCFGGIAGTAQSGLTLEGGLERWWVSGGASFRALGRASGGLEVGSARGPGRVESWAAEAAGGGDSLRPVRSVLPSPLPAGPDSGHAARTPRTPQPGTKRHAWRKGHVPQSRMTRC